MPASPTHPYPVHVHHPLPQGLLAGFHADAPDAGVPELQQVGEQWAPRRFLIPGHTHPVWEFYSQISGETHWDGPDATYALTPGGFLAVPPHVAHRMHDRPQDKHHFFFASLDLGPVLTRLGNTGAAWRREAVVFAPHGETLLAPFRQLVREVSLALPHRPQGMRLALDALVLEATRLLVAPPQGSDSRVLRHPAVRRARELLDDQPAQAWRLADLARLCGVSAHHLVACFTRDVGVSPRRYLLSVRVDRAKEMLAGSDALVTDIALELGFSSSQHFAATFKRLTGETAQSYRASERANR